MRRTARIGLVVLSALAWVKPAEAVPAFARRYGVSCRFCHEGFPKLSDAGRRFKERGFRMANEEPFSGEKWIKTVPVTARGWANQLLLEEAEDFTSGYLKAVSAGNLGRHLSYWADDAILVTEGEDNFTHVKPSDLWARLELFSDEKLYLKAGRFELDLPFTQVRTPHLFSYDVYFTTTGFERDAIGDYQEGGEVGGSFKRDWRWSAALVKGRNGAGQEAISDDVKGFDANVFLRLARRVKRNRFGAFAYLGSDTLARSRGIVFDNSLQRYGLDASVWFRTLNLYGVFLHGRDSNPFASASSPGGTKQAQSFDGGFAQADWHARKKVVVTARLNLVERPVAPSGGPERTFASFFPGVQVFILDHGKLSFEYGFQNQGRKSLGALQAEFAF